VRLATPLPPALLAIASVSGNAKKQRAGGLAGEKDFFCL